MLSDNESHLGAPTAPPDLFIQRLARQPRKILVRWLALSCLALAIGSLGTWARTDLEGITVTASGLEGLGWLTLLAAILTAVPALQPAWIRDWGWAVRHHLDVALIAGWVALGVCLYGLLGNQGYGLPGIVGPGWGLYVATPASLSMILWTVALRQQPGLPQAGDHAARL